MCCCPLAGLALGSAAEGAGHRCRSSSKWQGGRCLQCESFQVLGRHSSFDQNQMSVLSASVLIERLYSESFLHPHLENDSLGFGLHTCKREWIESTLLGCCEEAPQAVVMRTGHILRTYYLPHIFRSPLHIPLKLILTVAGAVDTAVPLFLLRKPCRGKVSWSAQEHTAWHTVCI